MHEWNSAGKKTIWCHTTLPLSRREGSGHECNSKRKNLMTDRPTHPPTKRLEHTPLRCVSPNYVNESNKQTHPPSSDITHSGSVMLYQSEESAVPQSGTARCPTRLAPADARDNATHTWRHGSLGKPETLTHCDAIPSVPRERGHLLECANLVRSSQCAATGVSWAAALLIQPQTETAWPQDHSCTCTS